MDKIKREFLEDLINAPPDLVASVWILNRTPYPFKGDTRLYEDWRRKLAKRIEVDSSEIVITGSGAFGVSLNPNKNFREFSGRSDIDIAIISDHFFTLSWRYLRNLGSGIHGLPQPAKQSVNDHVKKYIYWGTVATDKLLPFLPFGKKWQEALDEMSKIDPTVGRVLKIRVYRDFDSLRSYQVNNLKNLRAQEIEKGL